MPETCRYVKPAAAVTIPTTIWGVPMHGALKLFSYVVVLLMIIAIVYAGGTSIRYWSGIGV